MADLRGSQQNCSNFRKQFYPENQESFSGLKHYRPFCFKQTSIGTTRIHGNAHKKSRLNLRPAIKSRASIYLLILGIAAFGGSRRPAQAEDAASSGPTVLKWQLRNDTDQMTGKTTREAVSGGTFDDGFALQAHASCDQIGVQFLFDTFRGRDPAPFTQTADGIPMRIRIDNESVRTAEAKANYTNEAYTNFYDPASTERLLRGAVPGGQDPHDILGPFANGLTETVMSAAREAAPGTIRQLADAKSIRAELSLADGRAYVVDLNPQDDALKTIVQQCMADLHVGTGAPNRSGEGTRVGRIACPRKAGRSSGMSLRNIQRRRRLGAN